MPKNVLFNFINSYQHQHFEPKMASNGCEYFLSQLPISSELATLSTEHGKLTITSQHVSIYSDMERDSQYHYTADLVNADSQ